MDSNDVNTPEQMTNTIAHTDMVKTCYRILDLEDHVPGRTNLTGVQIDEDEDEDEMMFNIELANPMPPEAIAQICLKAVHAQEGALTEEEQIAFLQFQAYLRLLKKAANRSRTKKDMNCRFTLGSATRIVRLIASHGPPPDMQAE
jgi:hypothetical protein